MFLQTRTTPKNKNSKFSTTFAMKDRAAKILFL